MAEKAKTRANPPPPTEILSETPVFNIDETGEKTSPRPGFAEQAESMPQVAPEFQEEETIPDSEQPFTEEELGEEPTGDRLKDTQRAYHKLAGQVKQQAQLIHALTADRQIRSAPPPGPQVPPEMLSPEPTSDEAFGSDPNFPAKYMRRQQALMAMGTQQREMERELGDFVERNPDWPRHFPEMQAIMAEDPRAYQTGDPRALSRLHKRAKENTELKQYRQKMARAQAESFQAGADMGRQGGGRTFTPPGGASSSVQGRLTDPPADFGTWLPDRQYKWLEENGYVKPDTY